MIESKYILDRQDERDGGKTLLILSVIDESIGLKSRHVVAVFEVAHYRLAVQVQEMLNSLAETK